MLVQLGGLSKLSGLSGECSILMRVVSDKGIVM